jgi:16S rRNA (cytidine1402-2'-O)-methyltransferase
VVRELTKMHQEAIRAPLPELAERCAETPPRGEVCLVVGGAGATPEALSDDELTAIVGRRLRAGETPREIAADLAGQVGRRRAYQLALRLASDPAGD